MAGRSLQQNNQEQQHQQANIHEYNKTPHPDPPSRLQAEQHQQNLSQAHPLFILLTTEAVCIAMICVLPSTMCGTGSHEIEPVPASL